MINNIQDIKNIFQQHIDDFVKEVDISLIYIFGLFARGTNRKNSDIDLVIFNNVNEVLKFQVIKYGQPIYMESQYTKVMFESRTMSEYMDKEHFRRTQEKYSHMKFLEIMNGK